MAGLRDPAARNGMPIADIATFVGLAMRGVETVPQRLGLLEAHRQAVEAQWREVRGHLRLIKAKIGYYRKLVAAASAEPDTGAPPAPHVKGRC